jgi:hypothetical protein
LNTSVAMSHKLFCFCLKSFLEFMNFHHFCLHQILSGPLTQFNIKCAKILWIPGIPSSPACSNSLYTVWKICLLFQCSTLSIGQSQQHSDNKLKFYHIVLLGVIWTRNKIRKGN